MPNKTKKRKMLAQQRRRQASNSTSITQIPSVVKRDFEFNFDPKFKSNFPRPLGNKSDLSFQSTVIRHTIQDLVKALLLALAIISLELVIYWFRFR